MLMMKCHGVYCTCPFFYVQLSYVLVEVMFIMLYSCFFRVYLYFFDLVFMSCLYVPRDKCSARLIGIEVFLMESTSVWTLVCAGTKIVSLPSVNSPWNATFRAHHAWSGWDETRPTLQRVPPPRKPCTPGQWIAVAKSTDAIVATTSPHTGGIKQQTAIWSVDNTSLEDLRRPSSPARRKLRRWSACYALPDKSLRSDALSRYITILRSPQPAPR